MGNLVLKMPIDIRPTINEDGYVITDADNSEHFFYKEEGELVYDGWCKNAKIEE